MQAQTKRVDKCIRYETNLAAQGVQPNMLKPRLRIDFDCSPKAKLKRQPTLFKRLCYLCTKSNATNNNQQFLCCCCCALPLLTERTSTSASVFISTTQHNGVAKILDENGRSCRRSTCIEEGDYNERLINYWLDKCDRAKRFPGAVWDNGMWFSHILYFYCYLY